MGLWNANRGICRWNKCEANDSDFAPLTWHTFGSRTPIRTDLLHFAWSVNSQFQLPDSATRKFPVQFYFICLWGSTVRSDFCHTPSLLPVQSTAPKFSISRHGEFQGFNRLQLESVIALGNNNPIDVRITSGPRWRGKAPKHGEIRRLLHIRCLPFQIVLSLVVVLFQDLRACDPFSMGYWNIKLPRWIHHVSFSVNTLALGNRRSANCHESIRFKFGFTDGNSQKDGSISSLFETRYLCFWLHVLQWRMHFWMVFNWSFQQTQNKR